MTSHRSVLKKLKSLSNPKALDGMARYGINVENALGVSMPNLRKLARGLGKDHALAQSLWASGIHDARILACLVEEPEEVTENQAERWVKDFDSWDVCDGCCGNLFDKTAFAYRKAMEWNKRSEPFVKRAGFVLMAQLAVHDKQANDEKFLRFLRSIQAAAGDERNTVKKAVSWALRQIGKRNLALNREVTKGAMQMRKRNDRSAKWIASDALRELTSRAVERRLRR